MHLLHPLNIPQGLFLPKTRLIAILIEHNLLRVNRCTITKLTIEYRSRIHVVTLDMVVVFIGYVRPNLIERLELFREDLKVLLLIDFDKLAIVVVVYLSYSFEDVLIFALYLYQFFSDVVFVSFQRQDLFILHRHYVLVLLEFGQTGMVLLSDLQNLTAKHLVFLLQVAYSQIQVGSFSFHLVQRVFVILFLFHNLLEFLVILFMTNMVNLDSFPLFFLLLKHLILLYFLPQKNQLLLAFQLMKLHLNALLLIIIWRSRPFQPLSLPIKLLQHVIGLNQDVELILLQHVYGRRSFITIKQGIQFFPLSIIFIDGFLQLKFLYLDHVVNIHKFIIEDFFIAFRLHFFILFLMILQMEQLQHFLYMEIRRGPVGDPSGVELPGSVDLQYIRIGTFFFFHCKYL